MTFHAADCQGPTSCCMAAAMTIAGSMTCHGRSHNLMLIGACSKYHMQVASTPTIVVGCYSTRHFNKWILGELAIFTLLNIRLDLCQSVHFAQGTIKILKIHSTIADSLSFIFSILHGGTELPSYSNIATNTSALPLPQDCRQTMRAPYEYR